jgi:FkbM family methyltransferase
VFLAWTHLDIRSVLKKSVLIKFVLRHPRTWPSALRLGLALAFKRSTVRVASDGIWLFCGTSRGAGIWCAITGLGYEKELPQLLGLLRPGQVFVDIGANIGTYSIRAAKSLGPTGRVFACEPLETNRSRLSAAIRANKVANIDVVPAAIGDRDGRVTIYDGGRESSASISHTTGRAFDVPMATLDRFAEEVGIQRLDWIKMDIEGQEPLALAGMPRVIDRFRPHFLFENHEGGPETCRILRQVGYRIGNFDNSNIWHDGISGENLFAIASEKLTNLVTNSISIPRPR